ncbi:hypothetical protein ACLOJK_034061 [Asimina triloba]
MFRQASRLLPRSRIPRRSRGFSSEALAQSAVDSPFEDAWKKVVPHQDPPKTPMSFMKPRPPTPASIPSKLTVNFALPYQSELASKEGFVCSFGMNGPGNVAGLSIRNCDWGPLCSVRLVDMVIMPATTGQMGVLPGHVATIAELKPGILSVHEGNDVTKYFVSSGFAFIHANSVADIVAIEAVPVDRIDLSLAQKGLAEFTQKLSSASTDVEKAEAQIGVDVHSALNAALTG